MSEEIEQHKRIFSTLEHLSLVVMIVGLVAMFFSFLFLDSIAYIIITNMASFVGYFVFTVANALNTDDALK